MSSNALGWVMSESEATHDDRLVLMCLGDRDEGDGSGDLLSLDSICRWTRLSHDDVVRSLHMLQIDGRLLLREDKRRPGVWRYQIVMEEPAREGKRRVEVLR